MSLQLVWLVNQLDGDGVDWRDGVNDALLLTLHSNQISRLNSLDHPVPLYSPLPVHPLRACTKSGLRWDVRSWAAMAQSSPSSITCNANLVVMGISTR